MYSPIAEKFKKGLDDLTKAASDYEYVVLQQMVGINLDSPEGFTMIDEMLNMGGLWQDKTSYGYLQEDITDEKVYDMLNDLIDGLEEHLKKVLDRLSSIHSLISDTVIADEVRPMIQTFNIGWFGTPCGEEALESLADVTYDCTQIWCRERPCDPLQYELLGRAEPNFLYRSVHG